MDGTESTERERERELLANLRDLIDEAGTRPGRRGSWAAIARFLARAGLGPPDAAGHHGLGAARCQPEGGPAAEPSGRT